jgi:hypothetical protein
MRFLRRSAAFRRIIEQPCGAMAPSDTSAIPTWTGMIMGCHRRMGWISNYIPVKMQRRGATRPFSLWVILGSVGLVFCVFAWGLEYKLSLYDPPQAASDKIPQAKLWSRNERSESTENALVVRTKTSARISYTVPIAAVFLVLLLPLSILSPQSSEQRMQRTSGVRRLGRGLFNAFFVRPPPVLA